MEIWIHVLFILLLVYLTRQIHKIDAYKAQVWISTSEKVSLHCLRNSISEYNWRRCIAILMGLIKFAEYLFFADLYFMGSVDYPK
jgi:hypothetical protein